VKLDGIDGRIGFVTGGARGIGRRIAETFRDLGVRTAAGDLEPPDIPGVLGVEIDVADEQRVDRAFATIERELGHVELLVLNAGILLKASIEETSLADWQRVLDVNLTGGFLCARRALPAMRERGYGRIVAIGSSAGVTGAGAAPPPLPAYAASKAGIMALAKSIAGEYARTGVTANAIAPTLIDTGMATSVPAEIIDLVPLGRLGKPDEVADVAAFLCSAHADFITGEVVDVNGGFLMD
jgi:3-oxoacyl-[acyl-carrier protein] reductase